MAYNEQFIAVGKKADLESAIASGNIKDTSIVFLEEAGEEAIRAQGKTYQTVPSNGRKGQVLMNDGRHGVWQDFETLDLLSYGVAWKPNVADPVLTRVGNMNYHKSLPIQSGMRGCIYNPKEKKVVYWLYENDWRFKKGGKVIRTEGVILSTNMPTTPGTPAEIPANAVATSALDNIGSYSTGDRVNLYRNQPDGSKLYKGQGTVFYKADNKLIIVTDTLLTSEDRDQTFNLEAGNLSRLDGYDGEVMVYVPEFYIKSWDEPDRREVRISPVKIDETWEYQPAVFLAAYRDTVLNTVPENMGYLSTLEANTAVSVANSEAYCRGGNNNAANDANEDIFKRQLGKCRTAIARATFRGYARKAGKEIMSYRQYKNIMYWLYVIEYANFNSQATYNAALTTEGFRQGGLGTGLTNVSNWGDYNGYYAISPNGYTNEFGNGTGTKLITPLGPAPVGNVYATRWRGLENPFGDIWHNVDGIIIDADADNHPNNMNYVYTTDDPTKYGDAVSDIANMVLSGLEIHQDGYTKEWDLGSTAEIIPRVMGGNTTQYKCDYHWTGAKNTTLRTLLLGGSAHSGAVAGLGSFGSDGGVAFSFAYVGFRSVLVP